MAGLVSQTQNNFAHVAEWNQMKAAEIKPVSREKGKGCLRRAADTMGGLGKAHY